MRTLAGVDVGGTFTDVALVHEGRLTAVKLPTTIDDQSRAVVEGVELALEQAGLAAGGIWATSGTAPPSPPTRCWSAAEP